ncbi:DUF1894 domain-containing protein [Methanofollis fontis]|uniref:DUF1894 domain-containing protein n=1 Tax=Methanofollis fontis TaxID=2052832 RepID=A0A483CLN1_9EURY|nr:DUF1894 domain-containing protein [Methanofollis fontis]TAJ43909.1 hypothetical protein CUJ86_07565 [Methanofollis fontis]
MTGDMAKPHCINRLPARILIKDISPEEANEYIRTRVREHYELPPDYAIRDVVILGKPPMLVGILSRKKKIIFQFTKPCFGTALMEMDALPGDIEQIRADLAPAEEEVS